MGDRQHRSRAERMHRDGGDRTGMCVLTFHRVVANLEHDHDIRWGSFRRLLDAIPASETSVAARLHSGDAFTKRSVVLTFDDGTEDHMQVGEELARRGMQGIFFISAGKVGLEGRLSVREINDLSKLGHVVGSHGFHHIRLDDTLPPGALSWEVGVSKTRLEEVAGTRITYFAPPGGIGGVPLGRELQRHGYEASRSMVWGIYGNLQDRWQIPCVPVTEFSLSRGWVTQALAALRLPALMKLTWFIKSLAPASARFSMRKRLHDSFRAAR